MEKSGLKGNDTRDFNLLQEIIHYASAELDSEAALEQRLRMHLRMPDKPKNAADRRAASATKVATLLLLNALMLHSRIERAGGRIAAELGKELQRIGRADDPLSALIDSWTTILDHDYKPVFQPARRVATVIRDSEYRTAGWRGRAAADRMGRGKHRLLSRLRNSWGLRLGAALNSPGEHPFALDCRLDAALENRRPAERWK